MTFKPEDMMAKEKMVAEIIIDVLESRKGFEDWWYSINENIRAEIVEKIAKRIALYYKQRP